MKKLFQDFQGVSAEQWVEQIKKDLKGQSLDLLNSIPEPEIQIKAYYHQDDSKVYADNSYARNLSSAQNDWKIRSEFKGENLISKNKEILSSLNAGTNAIGITLNTGDDFEAITQNVLFEHIQTDVRFKELSEALKFSGYKDIIRNFDIININLEEGSSVYGLADYYTFFTKHHEAKTIWISGYKYGESGASTIQELAFTVAHLNEYIQYLFDQGIGLSEINEKIVLEISVNENYFVNIAKFRAIRELLQHLMNAYDKSYLSSPVAVFAKTNIRHLAENDRNNNLLRETTQAMSAIIGGCDTLTIQHLESADKIENERTSRISKNIQLILKEESYLDQVKDISSGSYYIESLTDQLIEKSWDLFLEIERNGGHIASIKTNFIQDKIKLNRESLINALNEGKNTFLGVNKYVNSLEGWKKVPENQPENSSTYERLTPFKLESYFIQKTV